MCDARRAPIDPEGKDPPMTWTLAARAARLEPSTIREILKLTERPGVISLAGGLPAAEGFPVAAMAEACARVLREHPREALQYAASEGFGPLREWVAAELATHGLQVQAAQIIITTGSQQGLDLVGKVLIDPGSRVAVELPTYLGALHAFNPYEAQYLTVPCDDEGPSPERLDAAAGARFLYLLPNFQNPSGRCLGAARRLALAERARAIGLPIVEDNPYGELWFEAPPPPPVSAAMAGEAVYLGSFSKVLAPGLRLGYVVAPRAALPQAAAGQAGGRPAHAGLQPARGPRGHQGRLPAAAPAGAARALQGAARRDARRAAAPPAAGLPLERARGRHVLLGRAAGRAGRHRAAGQGGRRGRGLRAGRGLLRR